MLRINQPFIEQLRLDHEQNSTFTFVFVSRENFLNKPTGPGNLFYTNCYKEDIYRHVQQDDLKSLKLPKSINEFNFYKAVQELLLKNEETLHLFMYKEEIRTFKCFDFEEMYEELDKRSKWYFYYETSTEQIQNPLLVMIKVFHSESQYSLGNVQVVNGEEYYKEDLEEMFPGNINKDVYTLYFQKDIKQLQAVNDIANKSLNKFSNYTDSDQLVLIMIRNRGGQELE